MRRLCASTLALLLAASTALAAPPKVPDEIKARPGQLVRVIVESDAEIGMLRSFTDEQAFFDELIGKPGQRRFLFQCDTPGRYVVGFWTKGELEGKATTIVVGNAEAPPPTPKDPPPIPPIDPPAPPKAGLYFMVVRPDGNAHPDFTKAMSNPAWDEVRAKGHKVRDFTLSTSNLPAQNFAGFKPPFIVALTLDADGKWGTQIGDPRPFNPATLTGDDIRKLLEVKP